MAGRPKQSADAARSRTRPVAGRKPLTGLGAVVAGATRGAGRGIARALGETGARVYCTGRSARGNRSPYNRPETVDETAEMISSAGGSAIALHVDHTVERKVEEVFGRVVRERGRLDILVNSIAGQHPLMAQWCSFWKTDLKNAETAPRRSSLSASRQIIIASLAPTGRTSMHSTRFSFRTIRREALSLYRNENRNQRTQVKTAA